ncbi:MAG TPA: hypothetical protein VEZ11_09215, partial [Thermoanaerobaculia bacterium]|nr:hypothetical protein [Thermoanaerobaculia bacterium]
MKRRSRRRSVRVLLLLAVALAVAVIFLPLRREQPELQPVAAHKPEAPPDLEKLRERFTAGVDALQRGDGVAAVRILSSVDFGSRAVEQYR